RLRPPRAASPGSLTHAAPAPLLGVDRATLGRSGIPGRLPLVQHAALLAGPHSGIARADRADGRGTARGRLRLVVPAKAGTQAVQEPTRRRTHRRIPAGWFMTASHVSPRRSSSRGLYADSGQQAAAVS